MASGSRPRACRPRQTPAAGGNLAKLAEDSVLAGRKVAIVPGKDPAAPGRVAATGRQAGRCLCERSVFRFRQPHYGQEKPLPATCARLKSKLVGAIRQHPHAPIPSAAGRPPLVNEEPLKHLRRNKAAFTSVLLDEFYRIKLFKGVSQAGGYVPPVQEWFAIVAFAQLGRGGFPAAGRSGARFTACVVLPVTVGMHQDAIVPTVSPLAVKSVKVDAAPAFERLAAQVTRQSGTEEVPLDCRLGLALIKLEPGKDKPVCIPPPVRVVSGILKDQPLRHVQNFPGFHNMHPSPVNRFGQRSQPPSLGSSRPKLPLLEVAFPMELLRPRRRRAAGSGYAPGPSRLWGESP